VSSGSPEEEQGPVVVGYDGREESERALEYALEEAASREVPVVVLVVAAMPYEYVDPYGPGVPGLAAPMTPIPEQGPLEVQPLLEHARRRLEETGCPGEAVWGLGDPVSEILRVADERKASAIVVGTHHHSALGRLLGTDTAADLVRESRCDVLVAR
jgi:nucleotide-binding universal stress UspA family protein